mmetsp:Transcript_14832/g.48585  ORF Transcript_14832/g.48585 Transcript_14832/m.48585 type:complete len:218 (+) Transcript_14832:763-1416(+)
MVRLEPRGSERAVRVARKVARPVRLDDHRELRERHIHAVPAHGRLRLVREAHAREDAAQLLLVRRLAGGRLVAPLALRRARELGREQLRQLRKLRVLEGERRLVHLPERDGLAAEPREPAPRELSPHEREGSGRGAALRRRERPRRPCERLGGERPKGGGAGHALGALGPAEQRLRRERLRGRRGARARAREHRERPQPSRRARGVAPGEARLREEA